MKIVSSSEKQKSKYRKPFILIVCGTILSVSSLLAMKHIDKSKSVSVVEETRLVCDGKTIAQNPRVRLMELGFYKVEKDSYFRQMPGTICTITELRYGPKSHSGRTASN